MSDAWRKMTWPCLAAWAAMAAGSLVAAAEPATFVKKPSATATGQEVKVAFEVSEPTDVEVAILGADGKVVRHLAAGVLGGKNLPPEPLKAGLAQELAWDGEDDFGKAAAGGPFKARVRAGMGVKFARFICQDPYDFGGIPNSLVAGEDGNLYAAGGNWIKVFAPDGRYLKTLMPFPADLPPGSMKDVAAWDEAAQAWHPRNVNDLFPEFYGAANPGDFQLLTASRRDGLLVVSPRLNAVYRLDLRGAVPGPALATGVSCWPRNPPGSGDPLREQQGVVRYGVSPDGKYLYLSGPFPQAKRATPAMPMGSIWRTKLDGSDTSMRTFVVVPATADGPWSKPTGRLYGEFSSPIHGIAADARGNVYVCDREKDRVAVFDEAGKAIGEIAVKNPDFVAIHPQSGAIYVIRRVVVRGSAEHTAILDKFNNFEKGAAAAATFAKFHGRNAPSIAVTVSGNRTVVWMCGINFADAPKLDSKDHPMGLIALEDRGAEFQPVSIPYGPQPGRPYAFARIATDQMREEVYVANGGGEGGLKAMLYRYNGDTGEGGVLKRKDGTVYYGADLSVGYDGLLYVMSGPELNTPVERVTHDLDPAPFPDGANVFTRVTGRCGHQGVAAGPDGAMYTGGMYEEGHFFISGWDRNGVPLKGPYLAGKLSTKAADAFYKEAKVPDERRPNSAFIVPTINSSQGGLRVDLKGNLYMGLPVVPKGYVYPAGFEKDRLYRRQSGSVVKFSPQGGQVLINPKPDPDGPKMEVSNEYARVVVEGALNIYPGLATYTGMPSPGNPSSCGCGTPRFDLDRYGRLVMPNVYRNLVTVVDNAGNVIGEFGKYGNFDSQYVPPDSKDGKPLVATPDIPMAWPVGAGFTEKAVYVCDNYNRRVVRADMTWKAEETCGIK